MSTTTDSSTLRVRLDHPDAHLPTRGSPGAAGYDLHSVESVELPPNGGRATVSTGIAFTVPDGTYGRISPRSGLAVKHGINVLAGVVDGDYTATVRVVLINHHPQAAFRVEVGDRIAQLILERIAEGVQVVEVDRLAPTVRGTGGFGSTGMQPLSTPPRPLASPRTAQVRTFRHGREIESVRAGPAAAVPWSCEEEPEGWSMSPTGR